MDKLVLTGSRSGVEPEGTGVELFQFGEDIQRLMSDNGNSFTALLELPPTEAMELLHSPESDQNSVLNSGDFEPKPHVKNEPIDSELNVNSSSPLLSNSTVPKSAKRKEREKKGKGSGKKSKNQSHEDRAMLPYVHVRARRGQATDSHSLAERARREKINARMKLLQDLVPGCSKISGTALVLDEIINHVQSLQHQVEFLSMRLASVNPSIDFTLDSLLTSQSGSYMDSNFPSVSTPLVWPEALGSGNGQQYQPQWQFDAYHPPVCFREEENRHNFVTPDSASLHSNQLKMEL